MNIPSICPSGEKRHSSKPFIPVSWTSLQIIILGLFFIIIGIIMSVWGFYISKTKIETALTKESQSLSFTDPARLLTNLITTQNSLFVANTTPIALLNDQPVKTNTNVIFIKPLTSTDYSYYQIIQSPKLTSLSYVGPCFMGVGCIIMVVIYVITFEARDRAAKIFPAFLTKARTNAIYDSLIQDTTQQADQVVALKKAADILNSTKLAMLEGEKEWERKNRQNNGSLSSMLLGKNLLLISSRLLLTASRSTTASCEHVSNDTEALKNTGCDLQGNREQDKKVEGGSSLGQNNYDPTDVPLYDYSKCSSKYSIAINKSDKGQGKLGLCHRSDMHKLITCSSSDKDIVMIDKDDEINVRDKEYHNYSVTVAPNSNLIPGISNSNAALRLNTFNSYGDTSTIGEISLEESSNPSTSTPFANIYNSKRSLQF